MLFIHGTTRKVKKLGWVADFCPICRRPERFRLARIGIASHIYFISIGQGKLVGYEAECDSCSLKLDTDPERYLAPYKKADLDISALTQKTFPTLQTIYADRLMEEHALLTGGGGAMDPDRRRDLLLEPFMVLNAILEARLKSDTQLDKQSGLGCFLTFALPILCLLLLMVVPKEREDAVFITAGVLLGVGMIYTFVQMCFSGRRYVNRWFIPKLAFALSPLKPTEAELQECLERCASMKMKIGKRVKLPKLWQALPRT